MNSLFVISRALLKNSFSLGKKKGRTIALGIVIAVSLIPMIAMLYFSSMSYIYCL